MPIFQEVCLSRLCCKGGSTPLTRLIAGQYCKQHRIVTTFDLRTLITIMICNLPSQDFNLDIALT